MRAFAIWFVLIVAVIVTSLTGILSLGTFLRAQSICPDFFDCEDARNASILFFVLTIGGAAVVALAWWSLGPRSRQVDRR
jgi:hypothetical protein